jgi:hypothetical protein
LATSPTPSRSGAARTESSSKTSRRGCRTRGELSRAAGQPGGQNRLIGSGARPAVRQFGAFVLGV